MRKHVLFSLALVVCYIQLSQEMVTMASASAVKSMRFEKTSWGEEISKVAGASRSIAYPAAFSPTSPPLVAGVLHVFQNDTREIWVSDPWGKQARKLIGEDNVNVRGLQWSPDGKYLAYYTTKQMTESDEDTSRNVCILSVQQAQKWLIADGGAKLPQWSKDATELFFWRRQSGTSEPKWQLYRAKAPWNKPSVTIASQTAFEQAGASSPDGMRVAGIKVREKTLVIEKLENHQVTEYPLRKFLFLESWFELYDKTPSRPIHWSWDSEWLYMRTRLRFVIGHAYAQNIIINLSNGKSIHLETTLDFPKAQDEMIEGMTAGWIPGKSHRLLIWAQRRVPLTDRATIEQLRQQIRDRKWLIYDVDSNVTTPAEGIPGEGRKTGLPFFESLDVTWSPDGKFVCIGDNLYSIH